MQPVPGMNELVKLLKCSGAKVTKIGMVRALKGGF